MEIIRWMYNGLRMGFTLGTMLWAGCATFLFLSTVSFGILKVLTGKKTEAKNDRVKSED